MFAGLLLLTALHPPGAGARSHIGVWNSAVHEQWWNTHPDAEEWIAKRDVIHRELLDVFERLTPARAFANDAFIGWLNHFKWLSLMPADESLHESFVALALNDRTRALFLNSLSPHDDHAAAMEILCRIHREQPRDTLRHPELAVAFAVVFDQPFPDGWPHHFVNPSSVLRDGEPPERRFAFYLKAKEHGRLINDPARLTVDQLKFVVDTPVPLDELAHLQGVRMRNLQQLQWLYQAIPYNRRRVERSQLIWPHGPYRVFTIQNEGGLCVDQAYYTTHTAKAKGVPSLLFLGQGNSGEHGWVGILDEHGRWNFDVGKIRTENYPVGQAMDPQTWRRLTDSQFIDLFQRPTSADARARARLCHAWVELNLEADFVHECLQLARQAASGYLWAWEFEADFLEDADPEKAVVFWREWVRNFPSNDDLRFRGERRLLIALEESGDTNGYERLYEQLVGNQRGGRFDLATSLSAERVLILIERGRWEEGAKAFDDALERLRTRAGGHLFYQLVQPYVQACLDQNHIEPAADAMRRSTPVFRAQSGSILDRDINELQRLVNARSSSGS